MNLAIASYIYIKGNTMIYYFKYDINLNVFERYSASHLFLSPNDVLCFSGHFQICFKLNQGFGM